MADDISETTILSRNVVYEKYLVVTADITSDETVTIDSLTTIDNAYVVKQQDGAECTFTKATNVITITEGSLTDEPLVIFVVGH